MLEPITKQELIDASADALTLEQVVNGTDTSDVTSRLARTYPTLAKALRLIVENGLLGATPFNLGSQMIASSLVDGDYAVVTDDPNPEINGFYQRQSGLWEYLAWNPLNQAKAYADANPMFRPVVLTAAADFNTLIVEGRTVVPTNAIAAACTNIPNSNAGVLDVALVGSGVLQVYRVFEFDLAYERQRLSNATWTDWVQSASKDMIDMSAANTLQGAKDYADTNTLQSAKDYAIAQDRAITSKITLKKTDDASIIPILADASGKALAYYDKTEDCFVGGGLLESIFGKMPQLKTYDDANYLAALVDANGKILIGWDKINDKLIGFEVSAQTKQYKYFAQKPIVAEVNHVLSYGQSLSMGATATTVLSTTQPYFNTTFNTSPRKDTEATSVIPLVEQANNPSIDGSTNRGETHCSGLANCASKMMLKDGISPANHVIFASTAGHGGYRIDQLVKGASWYSVLLAHVTKAKELNVGKTYKVQCVPWIQGENNAVTGGTQTPYATYKSMLAQLQIDANADIKAITAQTDDIRFITYQMSASAATWPDIAKAQLDLARDNDNFMLATPMYHLPYASDALHLTNVGYKWMGAYFGRAYKQYVIEGRKSDFINPLSAYVVGSTVKIKFDVPQQPLMFDSTTLAATASNGFKVMQDATNIAITSMSATDDTVTLNLASAPTSAITVRYALDYLGDGLNISGGASGNLRDSTTDTVVIAGITKPLYHVCPHFELTANLDKGI